MTKRAAYDILFILFLTSVCHLLFSKYGFNPSDEGFVLSATNRVLHGQIPHVDFSSVRPLGYAYLHIPELLISKTHVFLVSRFVFWLEQVLIAFLWIRFLVTCYKKEISLFNRYSLSFICLLFNVHYFPCSVLHTIDGLLMCMIGFNLLISPKKWNIIGFFFIGFAALCKQNYLVVLPVALYLFNRKNIAFNFIAGVLPIILYISFIGLHHGLNDLLVQLSGHNELLHVGFISYLTNPVIYFVCSAFFISRYFKFKYGFLYVISSITGLVLLCTNHYHGKLGFIFFSIVLIELFTGILTHYNILFFRDIDDAPKKKEMLNDHGILEYEDFNIAFLLLVISWCVSISVGYNTPILFSGACLTFILFKCNKQSLQLPASKMAYLFVVIYTVVFYHVRTHIIYRDAAAKNLTFTLDNIVEGAHEIYTNKNTYVVLKELDSLKRSNPNLIVVPDFTACNLLHSHESKILTEWPNKTEIPNEKILEKITSEIKNDSTLIFAIPVFQTALLKDGFTPQENAGLHYPILKFVKEKYPEKSVTKYFELRKM